MRLTIRHYVDWGNERELVGDDLVRSDAWDSLWTESETDGLYHMPSDRSQWERLVDESRSAKLRAQAIVGWLDGMEVSSLASYGSGAALTERWLHRLRPELGLTVSDFAPVAVERLSSHFDGADVRRHNLLEDGPIPGDIHLFGGVDVEFSADELRGVFGRFGEVPILLYPDTTLNPQVLYHEAKMRLPGRKRTRSGFWHSKGMLEHIARPTHEPARLAPKHPVAWHLRPHRTSG